MNAQAQGKGGWTRSWLVRAVALVVLALQVPLIAGLAPEPDPVPTRWELDFKPGPLRVMHIDSGGGIVRPYFFMTYRVTNFSGQDLIFAPAFDLVTAEGAVRRGGREVPPQVTQYLMNELRNPLLEDQVSILGQILQGVENAKDGLVVWPADDLETDAVQVFAAGLSGEYKPFIVRDPETKRNKRVMLRKTLMLTYATPGSLRERGSEPLELAEQVWVMR